MSTTNDTSATKISISKTPTGINGLDDILLGGWPQGQTTLVSGGPGTGKTVLGLEFLYNGALAGEPGIFITFEESESAIRRNAHAMGWDLQALEQSGKLFIMQAELPIDLILSGEFDVGGMLAILGGQVQALGAQRIVIDAIDRLLQLFQDRLLRQNQLYSLHRWLLQAELTAVITAKHLDNESNLFPMLDYLFDCVIHLDQRVVGQVMTRRMRVLKYRGSGFLSNEYPYVISPNGITLMPISTAQLRQQALGPRLSTGNSQLDTLLGGGFRQAASIVIAGTSGTGKTTMASSIAVAACARGDKVLYISFEESREALVQTMLSPGVDMRPALASQRLKILTAFPESIGAEEHLVRILNAINSFKPDYLILEAISATRRIGSEQAAFDLLVRLVDTCKAQGITSIFTNQTRAFPSETFLNIEHISGVGISSLIDTLLLLEQNWLPHEHERRLVIIKSRGSNHSHQFHTFAITDQGITFKALTAHDAPETSQEAIL
jgi:circadian clock protein KaiC